VIIALAPYRQEGDAHRGCGCGIEQRASTTFEVRGSSCLPARAAKGAKVSSNIVQLHQDVEEQTDEEWIFQTFTKEDQSGDAWLVQR
jgi:hypothetical protein